MVARKLGFELKTGPGVVEMRLPDDWRISPDDNLLRELRNWLQPENVEVLFS